MLSYESGVAELRWYSFVLDSIRGVVLRKDDPRIKVVSLWADSLIAYQLSETLSVEAVCFKLGAGAIVMTDGGDISTDLTDAPHAGKV